MTQVEAIGKEGLASVGVLADKAAPSEKPLRICLLGYRSAPFGGGQGIYLRYLSKALMEAGHKVDVISGEPYPHLVEGVRLIKLPGLNLFENGLLSLRPRHLGSWANIVEWCSKLTGGFAEPYAFGRRMLAYMKKHRDDYDIVHDNQSLCYGLLGLQDMGMPLVVTVHHPITQDLQLALEASNNWWRRILVRRWHSFLLMQKRVAQRLRCITTVSETSVSDIAEAFGISTEKIRLVHNGIDTDVFRPLSQVERRNDLLLATASADQPLKGLHHLLRALVALRKEFPELKLKVVGKPREGGATEALIKRLDLGSALEFVHGISTEALVELYASATIAVVPSLYEGFGLPAGEAMSCQVPLVSTDGGALSEVVGDAGLVVPAGDSEQLRLAIASLLRDSDRRNQLAIAGRIRMEQMYSWKVAARDFEALYREQLERNPEKTETIAHANG